MKKHTMTITENKTEAEQSRIIIAVNGWELDIIADNDGWNITAIKGETVMTESGMDYDENHINA